MGSETIDVTINDSSSDDDDFYINAATRLENLRSKNLEIEDDKPALLSSKKSATDVTDERSPVTDNNSTTPKKKGGRKKKNVTSNIPNLVLSEVIELNDDDENDTTPRTRSKTRGKIKKKTTEIIPVMETHSCLVDLTNEFFNTSTQSIEISDEEPIDLSVDVKIRWISRNIKRFELKKDENFVKIFKYFASLANVDENRIIITRNEIPISPLDTPSSLELSIIDILEGGFINESIEVASVEDTSKIKIKVQSSSKKFWNFDFHTNEKFQKIFDHCAKENNVPVTKLKCFFDGESIMPTDTPDDLDIEDEACFDLKIIS